MNEKSRISVLEKEVEQLSRQLLTYQQDLKQVQAELAKLRQEFVPEEAHQTIPAISVEPAILPPSKPTTKTSTEAYIGGNLLSKIGIAALVIGMAIFVKFAFENDLIGPWGRLAMGWGIGIGLVSLAYYLKRKYLTYSAVLLSGGVATAYFTTYAAFYFYHFLSIPLAFAVMVAVTLLTVWQATRYEVEWIALFGLAGAYAVPFLVGGNGAPWGLFVYMTILNSGILWLSFQRDWKAMNIAAFWTTWVIFIAFSFMGENRPGFLWTSLCFGGLFFVMMYANQLAFPLSKKEVNWPILQIILNAIFYFITEYFILDVHYPASVITLFTLGNAAVHGLTTRLVWQRDLKHSAVFRATLSLTLVFLILAVPIQFHGDWLTLIWAAAAYILYRFGIRGNISVLTSFGFILIFLATGSLLFHWYDLQPATAEYQPYLNVTFLTNVLYLLALGGMTYELAQQQNQWNTTGGQFLAALFIFMAYLIGWLEWQRYFSAQLFSPAQNAIRQSVLAIYTGLYLGSVHFIFSKKPILLWKAAGPALSVIFLGYLIFDDPLTSLRTAFIPTQQSTFLLRYGIYASVAWFLFGLYSFVAGKLRGIFLVSMHLVILWILSQELLTLLLLANPVNIPEQTNRAMHAGWSVLWGIYSLSLILFGFNQKIKRYRLLGITLFGLVLLKLLVYDLAKLSTGGKIIIFLSVGVLLLLTSFFYQKFRDKLLEED
ncbi:MAG: DUF2339 domain-containing protein [Siphonobacter sp.]